MSTLAFYTEQAADCRRQADAAGLDNVRDRCLSAATAWDNMAERARRTQTFRTDDAARKAAEPAAAAAAAVSPEASPLT